MLNILQPNARLMTVPLLDNTGVQLPVQVAIDLLDSEPSAVCACATPHQLQAVIGELAQPGNWQTRCGLLQLVVL